MNWLARELSWDTFVNVMSQYRPDHRVGQKGKDGKLLFGHLNRRPTGREMDLPLEYARRAGLHRFG